jgi:acyl carrier protein
MFHIDSDGLTITIRQVVSDFAYMDDLSDDDQLNLDSLNIAELLAAIEDLYGSIVSESLVQSDVYSIRSIADAIERALGVS